MEGFFFLIWKEANQAQRIQYKTKAEQNIFWQGLNNMKIVNSSATEKPEVSSSPYPPYLFFFNYLFLSSRWLCSEINKHTQTIPQTCVGPPALLQQLCKSGQSLGGRWVSLLESAPYHTVWIQTSPDVRAQCDRTLFPLHSSQLHYLPPSTTIWCAKSLPCQWHANCFLIWCNTFKSGVRRNSLFKNLPEATKEQERFLHTKMILYTEFRKHEMGPKKVTLRRKSSLHMPHSKSRILSHHGFFHHNLE